MQNTVTNLGASIGTALAGAVLISALTTSFLTGVAHNPNVPQEVASKAQVELAGGIPFLSTKTCKPGSTRPAGPPRKPTRSSPKTQTPASTGSARHWRYSPSSR